MAGLNYGFAEPASPCSLVSHLFPDKIGGRPAWLAFDNLPGPGELECPVCHSQMPLLLQLYSPLDENEDCFHRMLYVFMCTSGSCFKPEQTGVPFRVFRSQLPRINPYYSPEPPDEKGMSADELIAAFRAGDLPTASKVTKLCPVCGCLGTKACSVCKNVSYCCKDHQAIHWKLRHKRFCPLFDYLDDMFLPNSFLLPEFALNSEAAKSGDQCIDDNDDDSDEESDFESPSERDLLSIDQAEFTALEEISRKETKDERLFSHFKEVMRSEPDQVVRFNRGAMPLYVSSNRPKLPTCKTCGGKLTFEFQIMPQLLSYLKLDCVGSDSPDFATVYVFTCENSCSNLQVKTQSSNAQHRSYAYLEEFVTFDSIP